jgi:DNA end-binding protein Ku
MPPFVRPAEPTYTGTMPNAVWTGTLSFGLVSVPVRLFTATEPKDVRFHQYDRSGRRLRYRRVVEDEASPLPSTADAGEADADEATEGSHAGAQREVAPPDAPPEREVAWGDVVLGRETDAGDTVFVEREELERVRPRRSASIDIEDFVQLDDIDPIYFEKTYHAVPRTADDAKPYALLLRAMQRSGRVGIGRFVLRTKPHLVAVRPMADVLAVETLFFGDEVRDPRGVFPVDIDTVRVGERELGLAEQLIGMLAADWEPSAYADTYREELLDLLASKEPVPVPPAEDGPAAAGARIDALMAALRESVEQAKHDRSGDTGATRAG